MYYTVMKHDDKCRKHKPQASVFFISRVFSNVWSVLSQYNTRLRLLHLHYDIDFMHANNKTHFFYVLYSEKHGFLTNQSTCGVHLYYKLQ